MKHSDPAVRPKVAISALIEDHGKILLVRRGCEPCRGFWSLPGGSIELGESSEQALVREVREETSLEVEPREVVGIRDIISRNADGIRFHYVVIVFRAEVTGGRLAAGSDAEDVRWFDKQTIDKLPTTENLVDFLRSHGYC